MKIGFLHTSDLDEGSAAVFGSFERLFVDLIDDSQFEFVPYAAYAEEWPERLESCAGYLIPGAVGSANDEIPWVAQLIDRVRVLRRRDIPAVGVCYGHQLLGKAFGGVVSQAPAWEVGVTEITWEDAPGLPPSIASYVRQLTGPTRVYQIHGEEVSKLPDGAVRIATNAACENQAFSMSGNVLGIQGHPEFTRTVAEYYLNRNDVGLTDEMKQIALESLAGPDDHRSLGMLVRNFFLGRSF